MHKLASLNLGNNLDRAYLYGFQTKLAEYGLSLDDFLYMEEKTAGVFGRVADSFRALTRVGDEVGQFRQMGRAASDLSRSADGAVAKGHRMADDLDTMKNAPTQLPNSGRVYTDVRQNAVNQVNRADNLQNQASTLRQNRVGNLKDYGKEVAPAVGITAAGGGGLAYGAGDAGTTGNQMRNTSNQYLGTDFDTQSRFGALFG